MIFTLYSGKVFNLILSASAKYCRVGITCLEKQSPLTAPNFCMLLRKYLLGGEIIGISTLPCDRVVEITIKNENDFKENNEYVIFVEIMGKYSNVFLTQNGIILGSLKTTPPPSIYMFVYALSKSIASFIGVIISTHQIKN